MSMNQAAVNVVPGTSKQSVEVFQGYFRTDTECISVEFQAEQGASVAQKDAAFMAALAQKAEFDYHPVGVIETQHESEPAPELFYWAVTGRIPGDDEDTLYVFHCATRKEALDRFENTIWESELNADSARDDVLNEYGASVFINSVVMSKSLIVEATHHAIA